MGRRPFTAEFTREAVKVAHEKQLISQLPLLPGEDLP